VRAQVRALFSSIVVAWHPAHMPHFRGVHPLNLARKFKSNETLPGILGQDPEQGGNVVATGEFGDILTEGHRGFSALLQGDRLNPHRICGKVPMRLQGGPGSATLASPALAPNGQKA
jgi:hypothetical protein